MSAAGRYAPSPSGDLHIGNLRTALLAWMFARGTGRDFRMRVEDLDRARSGSAERQLEDLAAIGIDWDGDVVVQSARRSRYADALASLRNRGLVYECWCTRREIAEAASAPHAAPGAYPGTCRNLDDAERAARRARGRPPALRLRAAVDTFTVHDVLAGDWTGLVDDVVLVRNDGTVAYNFAVVLDDGDLGVDQVVRGDDLLSSAPRQAYLATVLGLQPPTYAHVPLVLGPTSARLAKRDGAVTLRELTAAGFTVADVVGMIADSLDLPGVRTAAGLLAAFDPASLPRDPWTFTPTPPRSSSCGQGRVPVR
ncbi:tRNA glutamyl-Q(34) synthetase GluQRS [Tersicoccus phoenicis]|uniref:Glutamyl-Q tRNA(Asp) synthetase n=1 Tax=Tersicoccus phoenicis TaxID=554083 RepID=A0A1R1LP23_9MICC|nr:tRNA glutamyl-Q(34) synthetase GluQRS [Tersicoccus phoenicis]OMH29295.1 tRNA glutamyl-Q(34) synthetase GluQRS [Tersicoccus phoenicis]